MFSAVRKSFTILQFDAIVVHYGTLTLSLPLFKVMLILLRGKSVHFPLVKNIEKEKYSTFSALPASTIPVQ